MTPGRFGFVAMIDKAQSALAAALMLRRTRPFGGLFLPIPVSRERAGGDIVNPVWLNWAAAACAGLLLAGCQQPSVSRHTDAQGLASVENSGMAVAKADPSAHLAGYDKVVIADLDFSHLQIVQPSDSSPRYGDFTLDDKDKAQLSEGYRNRLGEQLGKNGEFRVVDANAAKQPGTLVVFTDMLRLAPNAPRDSSARFVQSARDKTFTKGAGSMTLESVLVDAATGKTVAVFGDTLLDPEIWGRNDPVANRAAVERAFDSWGLKMRDALQAVRAHQH